MGGMRAHDVREALATFWKDDRYVHVEEVPDPHQRRIDLLVFSMWQSRGLHRYAVEIKVSVQDWKKELDTPQKADWWWEHCDAFYVAVPDVIASTVQETLPAGWGLLSVAEMKSGGYRTKVVVKPVLHEPAPLPAKVLADCLRCASQSGVNALNRAYSRGMEEGMRSQEKNSGVQAMRERYNTLRDRVEQFERVSGIRLQDGWNNPAEMWDDFLAFQRKIRGMENAVLNLRSVVEDLSELVEMVKNNPD